MRPPLDDEALRNELAQRLEPRGAAPRVAIMGAGSDDLESGRKYLGALADGGWAVAAWPEELGGRSADRAEQRRISAALREFAQPDLYPYGVGLHLVGPTVLEHGDDEQRRRWVPRIADGTEIWCQMFSEPDAGSDLANVGTRAERDADGWRLTGQKVWTSRGTYAQWGLVLARTAPDLPKHQGLSMFAVRMDAPGVTVRPLVQMNGDHHFCEVFLDEVVVPDTDLIGDEGQGWRIALAVLAFERAGLADRGGGGGGDGAKRGMAHRPSWLNTLADLGVLEDPVWRQRSMRVFTLEWVNRLTSQRAQVARRAGKAGAEGSGAKLRWSQAYRERSYLMKDAHGAAGLLAGHPGHIETLTAPSMSIRGGTDEIQRNIVGERVLGLPAEPAVDRDTPWSSRKR